MLNKKKKILFVIYHPVEPHFYFNISRNFDKEIFEIKFAIFESEGIVEKLTKFYQVPYYIIGKTINNRILRIINIPIVVFKLLILFLRFRPNLIFSATSPYAGLTASLLKIPIIGWSDTETATFNNNLSFKFFNTVILPQSFFTSSNKDKIIRYDGYKEISYLHPNVFTPDKNILSSLSLNENDKIVLLRFSALNAMHDFGLKSEVITNDDKILNFIKKIESRYNAKVFISVTERNLDERFDKYKLRIAPEKYIHLLSFCSLYIGEGTTTAAEAGVLGVPWINIQKTKRGYLIDQEENYGLGIRTNNLEFAFQKAEEYLSDNNILSEWQLKREKLLADKIDVSAFFSWFITNYPESHKIMNENHKYQDRFK